MIEVNTVKKFRVQITETLQFQEEIEAKNELDALEIVKEKYKNEDIVLDSNYHVATEFAVIERVKQKNNFCER